jgi:hypothetical protein
MAQPQDTTPLARLDESGQRGLCGSQQNGRYSCAGELGVVFEWTPYLRFPFYESAQKVRDLGFEVVEDEPPVGVAAASGEDHIAIPYAILRSLRFPEGWGQRPNGIWARGRHAQETVRRGRSPGARRFAGRVLVDPQCMRRAGGPPQMGTASGRRGLRSRRASARGSHTRQPAGGTPARPSDCSVLGVEHAPAP